MSLKSFFFPNKNKTVISASQAKEVGNKLFVDWKKISPKTLAQGMSIELEHKDTLISLGVKEGDLLRAVARIALDHLSETPHYYSKLKKVERK